MKLLLDEMFPPRLAEELRNRGIDTAAAVEDPDLRGAPDAELLERAAADGRVLVTENIRDFAVLHSQWMARDRTHPGILLVSTRTYPYNQARLGRLVSAIEQANEMPIGADTITFLQDLSERGRTDHAFSGSTLWPLPC